MRFVSFDAFRTCRIPHATYIKPDLFLQQKKLIEGADVCLYPEFWQINSLVFGLKKAIFPSLPSYLLGHNKIEFTRLMQLIWPQNMPETLILENTLQNQALVESILDYPFVCKTPRSSEGRGVFLVQSRQQFQAYCASHDVIYAQELLPIDRDCRIVVIGGEVVASYWRHASDDGFLNNIAQGGHLSFEPVPEQALNLVLDIAKRLDIDHAGFDVAMVGGHPYLFEFNRLFGNHGLVQQGIDLSDKINAYLHARYEPELVPPGRPPQRVA
jgi:ribosomal protein S6--L-glutamate ligase